MLKIYSGRKLRKNRRVSTAEKSEDFVKKVLKALQYFTKCLTLLNTVPTQTLRAVTGEMNKCPSKIMDVSFTIIRPMIFIQKQHKCILERGVSHRLPLLREYIVSSNMK